MRAAVPKVSVVMAVYNGMPLLRDAVASILDQTLKDFEFIVVNDGSTDGSLAYLQSVAAADPRVRIIDQANAGVTRAVIAGVAQARAPFVARMDADDQSAPDRLAIQCDLLERHAQLSAVSCGIHYFRDDGSHESTSERRFEPDAWPLMLALCNVIGGHGHMMFRRSAYEAVGGYDPEVRYGQDYELWPRLLRWGPMLEASGVLYRLRLGHDSISTRHRPVQREFGVRTATREYTLLMGTQPDAEVVRDTIDLWHLCLDATLPSSRLVAIDNHHRRAFDRYLTLFPERHGAVHAARRRVAIAWLRNLHRIPMRDVGRWSQVIRLAASWNVASVPPALIRRASRPLRGLLR